MVHENTSSLLTHLHTHTGREGHSLLVSCADMRYSWRGNNRGRGTVYCTVHKLGDVHVARRTIEFS